MKIKRTRLEVYHRYDCSARHFAVMGGAFWNMVGKQAQMVREEEQKEEANAISAIYIETGEFLKTGVFVDLNNGTIFSADIPAEGIYNKKEN